LNRLLLDGKNASGVAATLDAVFDFPPAQSRYSLKEENRGQIPLQTFRFGRDQGPRLFQNEPGIMELAFVQVEQRQRPESFEPLLGQEVWRVQLLPNHLDTPVARVLVAVTDMFQG